MVSLKVKFVRWIYGDPKWVTEKTSKRRAKDKERKDRQKRMLEYVKGEWEEESTYEFKMEAEWEQMWGYPEKIKEAKEQKERWQKEREREERLKERAKHAFSDGYYRSHRTLTGFYND